MKPRKPIFYDERRRRWRRTSRVLEICGAIFTLLLITFFISILVSPSLPEPLLPTNRNALHPVVEKIRNRAALRRVGRHRRVATLGQVPPTLPTYDPLRAAFYASWDPTSLAALVVDFEEMPKQSQKDFSQFISELATDLHASNLKLMVALPAADWDYDYAGIGKSADAVVLMNYDQHWRTSAPGPIAAQDWFVRNIDAILKLVPAQKLVMGIANYAYDWPEKAGKKAGEQAKVESFQESLVTASESEAEIQFDTDSLNPYYSYSDDHNHVHRVWLLDGVTAYNELRAAQRVGVQGTAIWRLGSEDPSIWPIWDIARPTDADRAKLEDMPPGYDLILEGDGDIWKFEDTPQKRKGEIRFDSSTNTIVENNYEALPSSYRIFQMGAAPKKIALSFDDGPDQRFTPRILDILKEKKAPATFFVIGSAANDALGLLYREYAEGHEIGNHTYTHHWSDISKTQIDVELNVTERLMNSALGVKTLLFRPPYGIDHQPETADEVALLPMAQSMGYLIVGARIDPHD